MTVAIAIFAGLVSIFAGLVVPATAGAGTTPECGRESVPQCHIDVTVRQGPPTAGAHCTSFTNAEGFCVGSSRSSSNPTRVVPSYFPKQGLQSSFTWKSQGSVRNVDYEAYAAFIILEAYMKGTVPHPASSTFVVTDAWNRDSNIHWHSGKTGTDGKPKGPLFIDYDHPSHGLAGSVHLFGYLERS
jgi:hypothetical protein